MADLASTKIFGNLTVLHETTLKANLNVAEKVVATTFEGGGSGLTGTANLRATGTTKADVGLSAVRNVASYSQTESDNRYYREGQNPLFGNAIGFANDSEVIVHGDSNTFSGAGWSGKDSITLKGDNNVANIALYVGHIQTQGASEIKGDLHVDGNLKGTFDMGVMT